jgi:hypothetical protein
MINWANQKLGNALKAACKSYLTWLSGNIENQTWKGGGGDLSEDYAARKQKQHGFTHPIGVASGQLLDNVSPISKNIKFNRGK